LTENRHKIELIHQRHSETIKRPNNLKGDRPSREFDDACALGERDIGAAEHSEDSTHGGERWREMARERERKARNASDGENQSTVES
jgi:hypothetical protein